MIVRAAVSASQRDNTYQTSVAVHMRGEVLYGYCTCIAGRCSTCNHVAALLFHIDEHNRTTHKQKQPTTCTSLPCQWKKPTKKAPRAQPVTELHIEKPQIGHSTSKPPAFEPLDRISGYVSIDRVMRLREDLSQASGTTLGFHQVWPETTDIRQQTQLVKQFSRWHAKHDKDSL